jgi:hypothetical protein
MVNRRIRGDTLTHPLRSADSDLGDHLGLLLEPVEAENGHAGRQLGYQAARDIEPGHEP